MSTKRIQIGTKPTSKPASAPTADGWVDNRNDNDASEPIKRLTIDLPASLHQAFKIACVKRNTKMADEIREMIIQKYGNQ